MPELGTKNTDFSPLVVVVKNLKVLRGSVEKVVRRKLSLALLAATAALADPSVLLSRSKRMHGSQTENLKLNMVTRVRE